MARYGKSAGKRVKSAMRRRKRGTLKSGRSGKRVTSRKQAIAIGLSEARKKGARVPRKRTTRSSSRQKKAACREADSTGLASKTRDLRQVVEVRVTREEMQLVLNRECRDPEIIRWDRGALPAQLLK